MGMSSPCPTLLTDVIAYSKVYNLEESVLLDVVAVCDPVILKYYNDESEKERKKINKK